MIEVDLRQMIEELMAPFMQELNIELVELNIKRRNKTVVVDIIADRSHGGITIDECVALNKRLAEKVELENLIPDDYVIEVCSPGLDRPLKSYKDFLKVLGRKVRFHLSEPVEEKIEHIGIVTQVESDRVVVQTKRKTFSISLEKINKALQVISRE